MRLIGKDSNFFKSYKQGMGSTPETIRPGFRGAATFWTRQAGCKQQQECINSQQKPAHRLKKIIYLALALTGLYQDNS